jgi:hypothetical protein
MRAKRSIAGDHSSTSRAKTLSSPDRNAATTSVSCLAATVEHRSNATGDEIVARIS